MYVVYCLRFLFNYYVSHYYWKRMHKWLNVADKTDDKTRFVKAVSLFVKNSQKCSKWQHKCDEIETIMREKYPELDKEVR